MSTGVVFGGVGGPTSFTLNPDADFAMAESCTVTVLAAKVTDQDLIDPPDAMAADHVFSFTTVAPTRRVHEIQDRGCNRCGLHRRGNRGNLRSPRLQRHDGLNNGLRRRQGSGFLLGDGFGLRLYPRGALYARKEFGDRHR